MPRIEICGSIASGKTTLARRLVELSGATLVEEDFQNVPFWELAFGPNGERFVFQKNLAFQLFHADKLTRADRRPELVICDFAFFQDLAYAQLSDASDLVLLEKLSSRLISILNKPALIIDVVCPEEIQLLRIHQRGRHVENAITIPFLRSLRAAIDSRKNKTGVPFLTVNSQASNFRDDAREVERIWTTMKSALSSAQA